MSKRAVFLQRRHYDFIAETLLSLRGLIGDDALHYHICEAWADRLRGTNGQFDWQRFLDASRGVKAAKAEAKAAESDWNKWKRIAKEESRT